MSLITLLIFLYFLIILFVFYFYNFIEGFQIVSFIGDLESPENYTIYNNDLILYFLLLFVLLYCIPTLYKIYKIYYPSEYKDNSIGIHFFNYLNLLLYILFFFIFFYKSIEIYNFLIDPLIYDGSFHLWKDFYIVKTFSYSEKIDYINKIIESLNAASSLEAGCDIQVLIPLDEKDRIASECITPSKILLEVEKIYLSEVEKIYLISKNELWNEIEMFESSKLFHVFRFLVIICIIISYG